jgi:hypothetical protein
VEKIYKLSGKWLGVNISSKQSDGKHNVMKNNSNRVSVRNILPFRRTFQIKTSTKVNNAQKYIIRTLLYLMHSVGFHSSKE